MSGVAITAQVGGFEASYIELARELAARLGTAVSPAATCTKATAGNVTTVTCNIGALAAGATARIALRAKPAGTVGQVLTDTASASESGPGDPHSGNDSSSVSTTVVR